MQLHQEHAIKETFKERLIKKASDTTGGNISDLRHSSNAETQINRINNMLRPTVTQGIGEGNVNETTHFNIGEENEEENNASPADPHFFIGEESRTSPVDTTHDVKVEELTLETFLAQQRFEMRSQEMLKKCSNRRKQVTTTKTIISSRSKPRKTKRGTSSRSKPSIRQTTKGTSSRSKPSIRQTKKVRSSRSRTRIT